MNEVQFRWNDFMQFCIMCNFVSIRPHGIIPCDDVMMIYIAYVMVDRCGGLMDCQLWCCVFYRIPSDQEKHIVVVFAFHIAFCTLSLWRSLNAVFNAVMTTFSYTVNVQSIQMSPSVLTSKKLNENTKALFT